MQKSNAGQLSSETKESGVTIITIRLLTNGKYVWTIESSFKTEESEEAIKKINEMDTRMKDTFPLHPSPGSGFSRAIELEE